MMIMKSVTSSNIAAVGYDESTKEARVSFVNGSLYTYADVDPEDFRVLADATSIGQHFNRAFKTKYEGIMIESGTTPKGRAKKAAEEAPETKRSEDDVATLRVLEKVVLLAAAQWEIANKTSDHKTILECTSVLRAATEKYMLHPLAGYIVPDSTRR